MFPHFSILIFNNQLKYIILTMIFFLVGLLSIASFNTFVDPYWLFREHPIWISSPALDTKQRFYKPLHIYLRNPEAIFIGSSRVYRGILPDETFFGRSVYNAGISSLNIDEMYSILSSTLGTRTQYVIIGLDYWMFTNEALPIHDLEKAGGIFNTLATALLSWDAVKDSKEALKADQSETYWLRNGFHHTNYKSASEIEAMYKSYIKELNKKKYSLKKVSILEKIIKYLHNKNIKVILYISPLHLRTFQAYDINEYKDIIFKIKNLANSTETPIIDFSTDYHKISFSLNNGSDDYWLDYSHFSPVIGKEIQRKLYRLLHSKYKLGTQKVPSDLTKKLSPK